MRFPPRWKRGTTRSIPQAIKKGKCWVKYAEYEFNKIDESTGVFIRRSPEKIMPETINVNRPQGEGSLSLAFDFLIEETARGGGRRRYYLPLPYVPGDDCPYDR